MYNFRFGYQDNLEDELPEINDIKDRFQHTYIVGKTGMGKSSLMERMAFYDMEFGNAVIYIDPHGNSVEKLYSLSPDKDKTIYISINKPTVINPLDKDSNLDEVISEFVQILDVLITLTASNPESTVLMREIIGSAVRTIKRKEDKNIKYLVKFLLYADERRRILPTIKDVDLRKYWEEFDALERNVFKNKDKIESAKRVASRLIEISEGRMSDFVIGQNEFDISDIIQQGKWVLVDTSHMSENARIYLSNLIVYSVLSYCEFSREEDKPLLVYVDEFQTVVSKWFADLLARARRRLIGFTLAHQNFSQIPKQILTTIIENAHTLITFRTGDEVADRMAKFYDIKSSALFNLEKYFAWIRIGTDNILIQCYPPLKANRIEPPKKLPTKDYNFLTGNWIQI